MVDIPNKRRAGRVKQDRPNPVDVHVGSRLRLRRTLLGMSQEKLGGAINLTFQQVQKYERGANRIGASRLFELAGVLDVPVAYFFEDFPSSAGMAAEDAAANEGDGGRNDSMLKRETLELVRAYYRISDRNVRGRLLDLVKALAADT